MSSLFRNGASPFTGFETSKLCIPLRTWHLCIPSYLCVPWLCLNILLAESTKGTPGGAFFKLLLASSLLIYIPLLCVPSILAFFAIPPLSQGAISRNSRNVHQYNRHVIQYVQKLNGRQPIQACPGPRTVPTGSSDHDVLVLWYKDFLTDSEDLISLKTTLLVTLADTADLICCFNR
ncbi:hypothetical protein SAMN04488688_11181 [Paenibacillus sp. cl141a]|nr:hypothetical protein SAMN04488688_11181 [Paenibacillus sp. cl141a]